MCLPVLYSSTGTQFAVESTVKTDKENSMVWMQQIGKIFTWNLNTSVLNEFWAKSEIIWSHDHPEPGISRTTTILKIRGFTFGSEILHFFTKFLHEYLDNIFI